MAETTTEAAPGDGVAAATQPVEGAQPSAAQPAEPTQGQPAQTDDTAAWLQSKGVDPNDPEAFQKVAQMAYHSEKQMTKATQEASELKKSLTPAQPAAPADGTQGDPMMSEFIQDYRRDKLINGFKEAHPDWHENEPAMVKILTQPTPSGYTNSQLVNAGILSLETVYAMAKASAPDNSAQIQTQAKQDVLQTLANTQRAGGGTPQASNSNPQAPTDDPINAAIRKSRGQ